MLKALDKARCTSLANEVCIDIFVYELSYCLDLGREHHVKLGRITQQSSLIRVD